MKMKIAGHDFEIADRFAEGYTLNANEASQMNQVFRENVGNNWREKVSTEVEKAKAENREPDFATLQAQITEYAQSYEFGIRKGGGSSLPADPIEREAFIIARGMVEQALKGKGYKLTGKGRVPTETINQLTEQLLGSQPDIRKEAKRRVDNAKKLTLGELNLGGAEPAA